MAKLLKRGDIINVYLNAFLHCYVNLFKRNAVGSINNIRWFEAGANARPYFLYGNGVQPCTKVSEKLQHINIVQCFRSEFYFCIRIAESIMQFFVLSFHYGSIINIERSAVFIAEFLNGNSANIIDAVF